MLRSLADLLTAFVAGPLLIALPTYAQEASFQGLGDLPGGVFNSLAFGVSADGSVVVGYGAANGLEAFRWTQGGGMMGLGLLPGGDRSQAHGTSTDGSVVVGQSTNAQFAFEAFRWTLGGGMVGLGDLPGGDFLSEAYGVSADGSVVVGRSSSTTGLSEAFRWTQGGGMVGLGDLPGGNVGSWAHGVSADGSVIVGLGTDASNNSEAFRWTQAGGMVGLGDLPGSIFFSRAYAVSADGSVVVGESWGEAKGREAFRWTQATGMVGLGDIPGGGSESIAYGISGDGRVAVGFATSTIGIEAFVWTATDGMQSLFDVLVAQGVDMTGWRLWEARAVSDDGRTVVGYGTNPQGQNEAFRAVLSGGHRWIDPTGGSWDVASNWSTSTVPDADDPVTFDLDATYTVTGGAFALGGATAHALGADAGTVDFELGGLTLTSTSTGASSDDPPPSLSVSFDGTAKIIAGTSTFVYGSVGYGSNAQGDTTTTARLQVFNTGTQLTGSEGLVVGGFAGGRGEVFVAAGSLRTRGAALGAGSIGEAVVGNGGVWTVDDLMTVGLLSTGRLRIENGGGVTTGRLEIGRITDADAPTSFVDVAGFGAGQRSRLFVADSLIVGGRGPAVLRIRDGSDVTAGHLAVDGDDGPQYEVTVGGAVTQGFDAELTATSLTVGRGGTQVAFFDVRAGGAVEVERFYVGLPESTGFAGVRGTATLLARAAAFAGECEVAIGGSAAGVLTITEGGLVACDQAGVGLIGDGQVFVGNNGSAPTASQLTVSRVLKVGEGGEGRLSLAAGVVDAVDAPSAPPADPFDVVVFAGGEVLGTGTIVGSVDTNGNVIPGGVVIVPPSPGVVPEDAGAIGAVAGGTLLVMGRVALGSGGTLAVPIAGGDSTLQGRLRVAPAHGMDGSVALGGALRLDFQNGYAPNAGDTFLLLDAASLSGAFASTEVTGLEPGWQFEVDIENGMVVLTSLSDGVATTFPNPTEPGAPETPAAFALGTPYPNPFNPRTVVPYDLPEASRVRLAVYDLLGREVAVLFDGERGPGRHEAILDGARLASGLYLVRLITEGGFMQTKRVTLLR